MMKKLFFLSLIISGIFFILDSCSTVDYLQISSVSIYTIKTPVAGNYPQGLYKYPYREITLKEENFTQTLEWTPAVDKVFNVNTKYTAVLTLEPVGLYTFKGMTIAGINGLPEENVESKSIESNGRSLIIKIKFNATADENAQRQMIFYDEFDGTALDAKKWDYGPDWDRQGLSSWRDDMVSVSGGFLRLKFKKDPVLGAERVKLQANASANPDNWIRAGAVRTRKKDHSIIFDNTYGYYEARIKFPVVSGTWGAFWLMSPTQHLLANEGKDGTEIDVVESIRNEKGEYNAALHWNGYGNYHKSAGSGGNNKPVNIYDGEFHTFAVDWSPAEYVFYVDGIEFWRADGGTAFNNCGINQNPNYIKITVESAGWAGKLPEGFTEAEMLVDYVRVYNQPEAN